MKKEILRKTMKERRKSLSEDNRKGLSEKIFKKLSETAEYKRAKSVCVYMDAFGEVKTDLIIESLRESGKEILFPVSNTKTHTLTLCRDTGEFVRGAYGILEPEGRVSVDFCVPDLIIVPGLAFDFKKNRVGFGAGYYDRLLSESKAFKIGICYDFQVIEEIDADPHDIKMDIILTDERIIV